MVDLEITRGEGNGGNGREWKGREGGGKEERGGKEGGNLLVKGCTMMMVVAFR